MKGLVSSLFGVAVALLLTPPFLLPLKADPIVINSYRAGIGASGGVSFARTDLDVGTFGASTTVTWSGLDFGAAASDRVMVATVHWRITNAVTPSGVTIGGETATFEHVEAISGVYFAATLAWAAVPTGTTGSVSVSGVPAVGGSHAVSVYRMTGCSATADSSGTDATDPVSYALTTTSGGIVVGAATNSATGGTNADWSASTVAVEDLEGNFGTDDTYTTAYGTATGTSATPNCNFTSGSVSVGAFAAFPPLP